MAILLKSIDISRLKVTAFENNKHNIDKIIIIKKNLALNTLEIKLTRRETRILIFNA